MRPGEHAQVVFYGPPLVADGKQRDRTVAAPRAAGAMECTFVAARGPARHHAFSGRGCLPGGPACGVYPRLGSRWPEASTDYRFSSVRSALRTWLAITISSWNAPLINPSSDMT